MTLSPIAGSLLLGLIYIGYYGRGIANIDHNNNTPVSVADKWDSSPQAIVSQDRNKRDAG